MHPGLQGWAGRWPLAWAIVSVVLGSAAAAPTHGLIATTTDIGVPAPFQTAGQGVIGDGAPYANAQIVEMRLVWTVDVPAGNDARYVDASLSLPTTGPTPTGGPAPVTGFSWTGQSLGWSGSGRFTHAVTVNPPFTYFGPVGTFWGWSVVSSNDRLLDPWTVEVAFPESSLAIDYIVDLPADLSGDGDVDDQDLGLFFSAFTGPGLSQGPLTNPAADLSGDGDVDDEDLGLVFSAFTGPLGPAPVPEPMSVRLLGLSFMLVASRRRTA